MSDRHFPQLVLRAGLLTAAWACLAPSGQAQLADVYWDLDRSQPLLDRTLEITLAPDLGMLETNELEAVQRLLEAGAIVQRVYEAQLHPQALEAYEELNSRISSESPVALDNLQHLYRMFDGPIATTLENERVAFLPVRPEHPGKAVYPEGIGVAEVRGFLGSGRAAPGLLGERTVVRRATLPNLRQDIGSLQDYPVLATLHPGLSERLAQLVQQPDATVLYAVPYSVAWAPS
ncbi:MAG TPA: NUDIX hydrolase, partial [Gammaproteobacteria bacterium]|nr:NUDIX hydrolase [Gammaproteobacteria bacterium]